MTEIRENIKAILPSRMQTRPVDRRGYPVPWFVTLHDEAGEWEFRVLDPARHVEALRQRVCWICGDRLGAHLSFAVGPMCGINRISAEPPQHLECAEFAVRACPFMLLPKAQRRDANLPANCSMDEAGLPRNPGVMLIWSTASFKVIPHGRAALFRMGEPESVSYWKAGRPATREEILESVEGGYPALRSMAESEGNEAIAALATARARFEQLLPGPVYTNCVEQKCK